MNFTIIRVELSIGDLVFVDMAIGFALSLWHMEPELLAYSSTLLGIDA